MKIILITIWAILPLTLLAYHFGPGQNQVSLDEAGASLERAEALLEEEDWKGAIDELETALACLPEDHGGEAQRIRLEISKARMNSGGLPEARGELQAMLDELSDDSPLYDDTLEALANARFHMTYLMKLEGLPDTEWEPEIEAARQERKLLHRRALDTGDSESAARHADDLESAIKLARMEPAELYGKAIPKPCKNCSSGKCKKPGNKKKPGKKKPQDSRSASSGPPIDGEGS